MWLTIRCFVVFLGLMLGVVVMSGGAERDPQTVGLLMAWAMVAFGITVVVAVLELLGLMNAVLEWLSDWRRPGRPPRR